MFMNIHEYIQIYNPGNRTFSDGRGTKVEINKACHTELMINDGGLIK